MDSERSFYLPDTQGDSATGDFSHVADRACAELADRAERDMARRRALDASTPASVRITRWLDDNPDEGGELREEALVEMFDCSLSAAQNALYRWRAANGLDGSRARGAGIDTSGQRIMAWLSENEHRIRHRGERPSSGKLSAAEAAEFAGVPRNSLLPTCIGSGASGAESDALTG